MKLLSPAKVNLTLNVGALHDDGYHSLNSVFHLIELFDEIEVTEADEMGLEVSLDLGIAPQDNLVMKAASAFKEAFSIKTNYKISLTKHIPHGAGLGGGSSDAATALWGLAFLNGIDKLDPNLHEVAAKLGADVPVFLQSSPANYMGGRGDQLKETLPDIGGLPLVVVMHPDSCLPTAQVYKAFDAHPQPIRDDTLMIAALEAKNPQQIAGALYNNLAQAAFSVDKLTKEVQDYLGSHELSLGTLVSGSGAANFALCATSSDAHTIEMDCKQKGYYAKATVFASRGIIPIS